MLVDGISHSKLSHIHTGKRAPFGPSSGPRRLGVLEGEDVAVEVVLQGCLSFWRCHKSKIVPKGSLVHLQDSWSILKLKSLNQVRSLGQTHGYVDGTNGPEFETKTKFQSERPNGVGGLYMVLLHGIYYIKLTYGFTNYLHGFYMSCFFEPTGGFQRNRGGIEFQSPFPVAVARRAPPHRPAPPLQRGWELHLIVEAPPNPSRSFPIPAAKTSEVSITYSED